MWNFLKKFFCYGITWIVIVKFEYKFKYKGLKDLAVKKQTFLKGILFVMLSQFIIKILGFVYRIVLTNFKEFGDVGNSYYGSGYTVYTLILAVATMGIPNTISKLVSEKIAIGDRRGAHKIFRVALGLFSFTAIIFSLMLFFGSSFIAEKLLSNPGVKYTLMALSPALIFVALSAVLRGYFIGMQNMVEYSKAQIIEQVVNIIMKNTDEETLEKIKKNIEEEFKWVERYS